MLCKYVPQPLNGERTVPMKPGLGLEFDSAALERYGA